MTTSTMSGAETGQGVLGLDDRAFFGDPWARRDELERALPRGEERCLLDAPREVRLDEGRASLPVVVLHAAPATPEFLGPFGDDAVLVATSARERRTYAAALAPRAPGDFPPPRPELPPGPPGWFCRGYEVDLRAHLGLPWGRPDVVEVALLRRDRLLGRARVALTEHLAYRDPAVEEHLAAARHAPAPLPIWPKPGRVLPSYTRLERSPPLPSALGLALTTERVVTAGAPERAVLWGSYRLPIEPRDRLLSEVAFTTVSRPASAVVPFSLLVTGSRRAAPALFHLAVPSYAPLVEAEGALVATGYFALNVSALVNLWAIPQTYFLHAFAGPHLAGPALLAVADLGG